MDATTPEVHLRPRYGDRLADAKAGVGKELEEEPPVIGNLSQQSLELVLGHSLHVLVVSLGRPADPNTCRWVRPDQTLFKRCREQRPHWGEHLPHASRRQPAPGKLGGKLLHVPRLDRRKLHPAEETDGITLE